MKGYKGFAPGLVCRGKQYAENTVFEEEKADICSCGMHFCENPIDVLDYYGFVNSNAEINDFAEVEALAETKTDDKNKFCTTKLKVGAKIGIAGLVKAFVDFTFSKVDFENDAATNTGYKSAATNTGDYSAATNTGYKSAATNTGYFRYRWGGQVFNSSLFQKVENIGTQEIYNNQDKRALYDRWSENNREAYFKGISMVQKTEKSSRFVMDDNSLVGESFNIGYEFPDKVARRMRVGAMNIQLTMADVFRVSTVRVERGIDYPFARSVTMSLGVTF